MKRFCQIVLPMKTASCYVFTAAMCILLATAWCLGWESLPLGTVLSVLLVSVCSGSLQILAFTDVVFKRLAYSRRMLVFALPFAALLAVIGAVFHWFPVDSIGAWGLFAAIFLGIFLVMSLGFELLFYLAGKRYDGLLGQYRKSREGHTER